MNQDRSLRNSVSQTSKLALLVINSKGKILVLDKFHDHSNHALIGKKSQQLAGKTTMPGSHNHQSERRLQHRPSS